ncbi:hypothetical protein HYT56_05060 [Candidatus Woesearchaeota archaeon]|nr:hypothetical protein [Candidatus Woesearchaeota archaeon]
MFNKKDIKKFDILLLLLLPLLSTIISLAINANFLTSTLLFFGLPSLWLSYRTQHMIKKTALFSLIFSVPSTIIIDYIAVLDGAWFVPATIFSFRLSGTIPIEDFIFGFLLVYSIIIFYEHFLDKGKHELLDRKMKYFIFPIILVLMIFFIFLITQPELLKIRYAYLILGIIFILFPSITFLNYFPRLLSKYVKTSSYFFVLIFLYELTGLQLNQWEFPGQNFIGWIEIFEYKFPFEEFFFFFFVLITIGVLSYYEFFDDDKK